MLIAFQNHLEKNYPELFDHKVLLAISGGIDSVVLAHLLHQLEIDFSMAHCNFNLREKASDKDADFVYELSQQLNRELYCQSFDTKKFAKDQRLSIQLAARQLRYTWFYELLENEKIDYLLTAHHLDDAAETYLINSIRGTGLRGLTGIPAKQGKLCRPLLQFSKQDILAYATKNKLNWREDISNASDKYLRNKIRYQILPIFKTENPSFDQSFLATQNHLQQAQILIDDYMEMLFNQLVSTTKNGFAIDILKLKKLPNYNFVLIELLKDFQFTDKKSLIDLIDAEKGKQIKSKSHILAKDKNQLLLLKKPTEKQKNKSINITKNQRIVTFDDYFLKLEEVTGVQEKGKHIAYFNLEQLTFPLVLRNIKNGDVFQPFGMKGKKKVSDFLKDEKIPTIHKKNQWVLLSNEEIIWVVNFRSSEKYRVQSNSEKCLKISCFQKE
ncbi:MAG: tRNA lysidine(34) synthetase TilS [Bacteroidota bacterium]